MTNQFASLSRSTKVVLLLGSVLLLIAVTGVLRTDRGVKVTKERAIAIAQTQIDFEPEQTSIRLVRQGFGATPFWAVSFSIPAPDGNGYTRLTTVMVNGDDGEIAQVSRGE